MRRGALVGLLGSLVALGVLVVPWVTKERDYPATISQPPPLFTAPLVPIGRGDVACARGVTLESHSEQARFVVGTLGKPGPPLMVTVRWKGAVERRSIPGGYADNSVLGVFLDPPPGPRLASICFENRGRVSAYLHAADSTRPSGRVVFGGDVARSATTVNGRPAPANVVLGFYEREPQSILARIPVSAERIAVFRPGGAWFVWLLGALFVAGIPTALGWALLRASSDTAPTEGA